MNAASGMNYEIVVHGASDRGRYRGVRTDVNSPPAFPRAYHPPSAGERYPKGADVMLLRIYYHQAKSNPIESGRFYVPSRVRSENLAAPVPICVVGTPGPVVSGTVIAHVGQPVQSEHEYVFLSALNQLMMVPNRRGLSFGAMLATNGRQVKHNASAARGMTGGVGLNMTNRGLFEFIHIASERTARDHLYNRGVSKDDPWLVCALVENVIPNLALCNQFSPGQRESLVTWLANHKETLRQAGLWDGVERANFAL